MTRHSLLGLVALLAGCGSIDEGLRPVDTTPAPEEDVLILVDDLGISHVYAQSDADAFFGAGYAMARDRLFQMELVRRRALGRTAEIFGSASLGDDIASRALRFDRLGAADAERARQERPEEAGLIAAWAEGINRRIAQIERGDVGRPYGLRATELDFVPQPWTADDAYMIGKLLAFGLSNTLDPEVLGTALLRNAPQALATAPLLPAYDTFILPMSQPTGGSAGNARGPQLAPRDFASDFVRAMETFGPPLSRPTASNNWAVDGAHSETGRPWLAGDPHQELTSPTRLWPVHMSSVGGGGTLDVIGFAFVGTPTVELGHNAHVGWTATTNFGDAMDLLDVTVDEGAGTAFVAGEPRALSSRTETIQVRRPDAPFGESDAQEIVVREVPGFGVILPAEILPVPLGFLAEGELLFLWTGFRATLESSAYVALDRARDLDELEAAVDLLEIGAINVVAADAGGISYRVHVAVPDRGDPASRPMPWRAVDGADPANAWTRGDLPASQLPRLRDPQRGWLATANNDPFGFTVDGSVENDPFYYGGFYANGFRAHRIEEALDGLLAGGGKVGRADMEALQRDVRSPMADTLVPRLAEALAAIGSDPALDAWVGRDDLVTLGEQLTSWDRRFSRDRGEPLVLLGLEWFAARRAFSETYGPFFEPIGGRSPSFFLGLLRNVVEHRYDGAEAFAPNGVHALLVGALDDTASWLQERFGTTDPAAFAYGDVHAAVFQTTFGGELVVPRIPVDGSTDTVNVSPAAFFADGAPLAEFASSEMALYRMVVGFAEDGTPEATVDFARGTSEEPDHPHFADQDQTWSNAEHVALPFRRADVDARTLDSSVIGARARR